ncbi:MAG: hypothetical protein GY940_24140 [bacterium]|nr:hypothetical protein [bacterium]
MALFSKKQKSLAGIPGVIHVEDEILGYLDEVTRQRTQLSIRTKDKHWDCSLYSFDLKSKLLRIEDSFGLSEQDKKAVQCGFTLDSTWFLFTSQVHISGGKPYLTIPSAIQHKERRKKLRSTISSRELVKVTVLQSLGAGVGVTGKAAEISEDTIQVTIERALMMENERELSPSYDLIKEGTKLMVVKAAGLPGVPTFQVEGVVLRITQRGGWKLAVQLKKLPKKFQDAIGQFVRSRSMPYKPTKRSYKRRLEVEKEREKEEQEREQQRLEKKNSDAENSNGDNSNGSQQPSEITFATEIESSVTNSLHVPKIKPRMPVLLSIGDMLRDSLAFLGNVQSHRWVHVESPLKIIKSLNENKPAFLLTPVMLKRQSMLDYLEKISGMGVLSGVDIILFSEERIPPKDLIRCRMLGIRHTLQLPLDTSDQLLGIISPGSATPQ